MYSFLSIVMNRSGTDRTGKGMYYNGLFDGLYKIFRVEGVLGLYKGIFPTLMRSTPHVILCQVFYEKLSQTYDELR